jgi:periplasmic protein TonB
MFDQIEDVVARPRRWTTVGGVALEATALAFLLVAPLMTIPSLPEWRPKQQPLAMSVSLAPPPTTNVADNPGRPNVPQAPPKFFVRRFVPPTTAFDHVTFVDAPPEVGVPGPPSAGIPDGFPRIELQAAPPVVLRAEPRPIPAVPAVPAAQAGPVKVGGKVQEANLLIHQVPAYPPIAVSARVQGAVVLEAIIGKDGRVKGLVLQSGPPLLVKAAMDAVRGWVYRPTTLNGEPVEVQTTITVNFVLGR